MGNESSSCNAVPKELTGDEIVLHRAAQVGDHHRVRCIITQKSAILNCADPNGNTALHKAAWHGHLEACKLLVKYGAQLHATNKKGMTPLSLAVERARAQCAEFLEDMASLPDPAEVKRKFRVKSKTSNCAKVYGPRQSIKGRHGLIPGVPIAHCDDTPAEGAGEPSPFGDAVHWEVEQLNPSCLAARPQSGAAMITRLNSNLVDEDGSSSPTGRRQMITEERFFNVWKSEAIRKKDWQAAVVQEVQFVPRRSGSGGHAQNKPYTPDRKGSANLTPDAENKSFIPHRKGSAILSPPRSPPRSETRPAMDLHDLNKDAHDVPPALESVEPASTEATSNDTAAHRSPSAQSAMHVQQFAPSYPACLPADAGDRCRAGSPPRIVSASPRPQLFIGSYIAGHKAAWRDLEQMRSAASTQAGSDQSCADDEDPSLPSSVHVVYGLPGGLGTGDQILL